MRAVPRPAGATRPERRRRRRRRRRPSPYLLVGGAYWLLLSVVVWHTPIASDFGQHAAAVEQVRRDWRHPANPLLDAPGTGSPYYSPYIVGLGLTAKATGVAGRTALRWCGVLNLAVLVAGVGAYARTLSARTLAPVYALAAFSLLWGVRGAEWSGFCGVWSLTRGASYPSAFAVGLAFLLWTWTDRLARRDGGGLRRGRGDGRGRGRGGRSDGGRSDGSSPREGLRRTGWWQHAGLGVLGGGLLLIHPVTALAAAVGVAATLGTRQRGWSWRVAAGWALTACAATAVAAAWPYFDVFALAGDPTLDRMHRTLYQQPFQWYGLAAVGLPALVRRARAAGRWRVRDPLVLMFAADCLIAGYGWASGHYTYGRVFALLLGPPQFALAVETAESPRRRRRSGRWPGWTRWTRWRRWAAWERWPQPALGPLAAAALCCGLVTQAGAVAPRRLLPVTLDRPLRWHDYRWAADRIRPGDVLLTDGYQASHALPAYGIRLVAPTWPDPSTPASDRERRFADLHTYLNFDAPAAARRAIVHRYGARWLLLTRDEHIPYEGTVVDWDVSSHERLIRLGGG